MSAKVTLSLIAVIFFSIVALIWAPAVSDAIGMKSLTDGPSTKVKVLASVLLVASSIGLTLTVATYNESPEEHRSRQYKEEEMEEPEPQHYKRPPFRVSEEQVREKTYEPKGSTRSFEEIVEKAYGINKEKEKLEAKLEILDWILGKED